MADVLGSLNQATAKKKVAKKPVAAFDALSVLGNALNAAPPVKRKPLLAQPVAGTRVDGVLNETTGQLTAKPLMAQPVPGTSANGLKNEVTGEDQNAQGQKVKRYNLVLENGVNLSFDSNRELTPDELQQTVNDIGDREEFKKLEKVAAAKKKERSQMATPNVGPYSNQTIAENNQRRYEQMMGPDGLAIAKKMTPQQIQSLPIEVRRSLQSRMIGGMNKAAQGLLEGVAKVGPRAAEWVGMGIQDIIDPNVLKPSDYSIAKGLKPEAKAKMAPAAKVVEAGANVGSYFLPYVGQMRGAVDTANIAQRIASGDGQQVVKETLDGLNVFDPNIDGLERGLRAINVMGAVYGGYHLSKGAAKGAQAAKVSKQLKISVPEALKIVNWAEEASAKAPKRTGVNKAGREDAKGTAASIALGNYEPPVAAGRGASNVPIPTTIQKPELKPVGGVARTQVGPSPMQIGPMTGATVEGRRPNLRAVPVEPTGVADRGTRTILNRSTKLTAQQEAEAAANRLKNPTPPQKALPGRTPEPAPVAVQAKPEAPSVVAKAAEPKVERPAPTPKEPAAAKGKEPWEMTRAEIDKASTGAGTAERYFGVGGNENAVADVVSGTKPTMIGFDQKGAKSAAKKYGLNAAPINFPAPPAGGIPKQPIWVLFKDTAAFKRLEKAYLDATNWNDGLDAPMKAGDAPRDPNPKLSPNSHSGIGRALGYSEADIARFYSKGDGHKSAVEQALKESKPVPDKVLADYPDLAAKYKPGAKEPAAKVETPVNGYEPIDLTGSSVIDEIAGIEKRTQKFFSNYPDEISEYKKIRTSIGAKVDDGYVLAKELQLGRPVESFTNDELRSIGNATNARDKVTGKQLFPELQSVASKAQSELSSSKRALRKSVEKDVAAGLFEPTPKTGLDAVIQAGEEASARLKKGGTGNKNRQRGASGITPEDLKDLTIVVAGRLAKGAKTFQEVAAYIKKEFPAHYEAFVRNGQKIYTDAKVIHRDRVDARVMAPKKATTNEAKVSTGIETPAGTKTLVAGGSDASGTKIPTKVASPATPKIGPAGSGVTAESVGVKSGMQDPHAGKTGVWKGPDADQPIKIEKTLGTKDGRTYVKVEGSNTGIPLDEITVDAPKPSSPRTRASKAEPSPVAPTAGEPTSGAAISNKFFKDQTDADVPDADRQTVKQWVDAAIGAGHHTEAGSKKLVADVLEGSKRDFTESEGVGIAARLTDLLTEKGTKGIDPNRVKVIDAEIQRIAEATKKTGTNQARAFVARAMLIGNDYSPQGVYRAYELAGGKSPDAGIRAQLDAAIQRNAELTKLLDAKEKGATVTKGDVALLDTVRKARASKTRLTNAQDRLDAIKAKRAGAASGMGSRERGAANISKEDIADLKELAGAYAQMGVARFQYFVDRIRGDFKEEFAHLSDEDIAEALNQKTGDARTLEEKIIQQNIARLKREAKYIDENAARPTKEAQALERVKKQIADTQARIDSGNVKGPKPSSEELKAARAQLAKLKRTEKYLVENASRPTKDSQRRIRVQEQIDDYENQLKTGVFKDRSKPKMKASVELENLRARRDLARQEIDSQLQAAKDRAEYEAKSWGGKRAHDFRELSRGLVLGADLASSTTQGAYHIFPSPKQSALSFWGGVKAAASESGLRNELALVRENPNYAIKVKSGLKLDAVRGGSSSEFTSTSVGKLPIYKQSNRFLDAQLTLLRSRLWDKYEASYRRLAKVADGQSLTPEDYALISEQVNTTTGAGTGDIARFLTQLSKKSGGVLLAPGYRVSRVKQALGTNIWNAAFVQKNPKMARLFLQDHLVVLGMVGATAGGLKAAGVDVELDPRSTDFLKARNNNQIYDLTFGMAAPLRMMAQAYAGMKASRGENEKDKAASTYQAEGIGSVMDYMISSLAPHVQLINQVATQVIQRGTAAYDKKDQRDLEFKSFGKNVDLTTKDGVGNFMMGMTPIAAQQIKEIANAPGMDDKQKALLMTGAIFGISAKVKPQKKEETKEEKQRRLRKPGQRIFDMELPKR